MAKIVSLFGNLDGRPRLTKLIGQEGRGCGVTRLGVMLIRRSRSKFGFAANCMPPCSRQPAAASMSVRERQAAAGSSPPG